MDPVDSAVPPQLTLLHDTNMSTYFDRKNANLKAFWGFSSRLKNRKHTFKYKFAPKHIQKL